MKEAGMELLPVQIDLLSAFNAHGVEYLIVGGHAVNAYTQARYTKDLGILIRNNAANGIRVFEALASFGAPLAGLCAEDFFGKPEQFFQIGVEPDRIDLLQGLPGVDVAEVWGAAVSGILHGVPVCFIARDHLFANKIAAGRPRDLGDVDELQKFARELK